MSHLGERVKGSVTLLGLKGAIRSVRPELKKPGMNSNRNKLCTGEERLSDGVARRWRDAPSKKSPWICRSGTRQSVCSSGAGALPSLQNFAPLFRPVLLLFRKPRRIGHDRGAGSRFDLLDPSGPESGAEFCRDCCASLPLPHKLCLELLRQIHVDFLLGASVPPRPHRTVTPVTGPYHEKNKGILYRRKIVRIILLSGLRH